MDASAACALTVLTSVREHSHAAISRMNVRDQERNIEESRCKDSRDGGQLAAYVRKLVQLAE